MKPYIHQSFWSDRDIEAQPSEIKLVALWLFTNPQTSILGFCEASESRFSFETDLPKEDLQRAIEALPRTFDRVGGAVFIRNFIRRQFGAGESLVKNNFFRTMTREFLCLDADLAGALLFEYPEFQSLEHPTQSPTTPKKPLARASLGLAKPKERKVSERKGPESTDLEDLKAKAGGLFRRQAKTVWSEKEIKALRIVGSVDPEDWTLIERYYSKERYKGEKGIHRRDLLTFLNNFTGEVDRARGSAKKSYAPPPAKPDPIPDPDWWPEFVAAHPRHKGKHVAELCLRDQEEAKDWGWHQAGDALRAERQALAQEPAPPEL